MFYKIYCLVSVLGLFWITNAADIEWRTEITNSNVDGGTLNPLFQDLIDTYELIPNSHLLIRTQVTHSLPVVEGMQYYSTYGVFFNRGFKIGAHRDYQCSICNGDFMAIMIPKYLHPQMAKICYSTGECEDANEKGYFKVNVCQEHFTQPGLYDRIQLNVYYTNSTSCQPLGMLDKFDCEAELFDKPDSGDRRRACITTNPMLLSSVNERNEHWFK